MMKTRYREHKRFGRRSLLVLQLGSPANTGYDDDICPSRRGMDYTSWRDATVEDLVLLRNTPTEEADNEDN